MQDLQAWAKAHPNLAKGSIPVAPPGAYPLAPLMSVPIHRATGGPSGTDTVPAWLSPGEFVMKQAAVNKYGTKFMSSVNAGKLHPVARSMPAPQ